MELGVYMEHLGEWLYEEVGEGRALRPVAEEVARVLRETGSPDALVPDDSLPPGKLTLLQKAVVHLDPEAVALLLESGADPGLRGRTGFPPLHYLVVNHYGKAYRVPDERGEDILALFLAHGADIEARDEGGRTLRDHIRSAIRFYREMPFTFSLELAHSLEAFLRKVKRAEGFARERLSGRLKEL